MAKKDKAGPLRRGVRRLSDPRAVGWPVLGGTLILWVLSSYAILQRDNTDPAVDSVMFWLVSLLVGHTAFSLVLLIAKKTWWGSAFGARHPSVAMWTIVLATVTGISAANITGDLVGADHDWVVIGVDYFVLGVVGTAVMGSATVGLREHWASVNSLLTERGGLTASLDTTRSTSEAERERTILDVDGVLERVLGSLRGSRDEAIDQLNSASADVLRPLSHKLALGGSSAESDQVAPPRPRWSEIFERLTARPLIAPRLTAFLVTAVAWRLSITDAGETTTAPVAAVGDNTIGLSVDIDSLALSLVQLTVVFGATFAVSWAVDALSRRLVPRVRVPVRWAVIVAGVAVISLVSLVAISQALRGPGGGAEFDYAALPLVLILLTVSMISAGVGFTRTVSAIQEDVRAQLRADIDRLHWELARLKQEIWLERRELALALHGPLRAALVSSAMELGQHSGPLRDELVSKLHQRIVDARSRLSEPRAKEGLLETWKALKDLWQGSCSITWSINASTLSRLEKDPLALRSLQQISDEACANAITHANPSCIEIDVVSRESVLEVTVVNDGATSQGSAREGLGSLLLNEVCLDWEFFLDGDRACLRASLPIAPQ